MVQLVMVVKAETPRLVMETGEQAETVATLPMALLGKEVMEGLRWMATVAKADVVVVEISPALGGMGVILNLVTEG